MMDIEPAKLMWNWMSDEEVSERVKLLIEKGKVVIATQNEKEKIERGEWLRVGTWAICDICGKAYVEHPTLDSDPYLHRLCNGVLGKT